MGLRQFFGATSAGRMDAATGLALAPRERVLVSAASAEAILTATTLRLVVRPQADHSAVTAGSDAGLTQEWPWVEVDHASFDRDSSALTLAIRPRATGLREEHSWVLPSPGKLPAAVHERVRATMVISESVPRSAGTAVDVTVRRDLDTQEMTVQVTGAPPVGQQPALDAAIERAVERVRDQVGAPH